MPAPRVLVGRDAEIWIDLTTAATQEKIAKAQSLTLDIGSGAEEVYEVGSRIPIELVVRNQTLSGTLSRLFFDKKLVDMLSGSRLLTGEFFVYAKGSDDVGSPYIYVFGCKSVTGSLDIPQDGNLMFDLDFIGKTFTNGEKV